MKTVTIAEARSFSLEQVERRDLVQTDDLHIELICFEAGQRAAEAQFAKTVVYQVLEGEALIRQGETRERLGKGKLLSVAAAEAHALENAGGGLLVVMATHAY